MEPFAGLAFTISRQIGYGRCRRVRQVQPCSGDRCAGVGKVRPIDSPRTARVVVVVAGRAVPGVSGTVIVVRPDSKRRFSARLVSVARNPKSVVQRRRISERTPRVG